MNIRTDFKLSNGRHCWGSQALPNEGFGTPPPLTPLSIFSGNIPGNTRYREGRHLGRGRDQLALVLRLRLVAPAPEEVHRALRLLARVGRAGVPRVRIPAPTEAQQTHSSDT